MNELDNICKSGFSMTELDRDLTGLAFLSLKVGLKSYFSTYQDVKYNFTSYADENEYEDRYDRNYFSSYYEHCSETIIHFQHFCELISKSFLRDEHQLLAVDAKNYPTIYHKLLNKEDISSSEMEKLYSIDFRTAIKILNELIKKKRIKRNHSYFIRDYLNTFEKLNILRNRLLHRGTFILRYYALDKLIGKYVLPFVTEVISLPEYQTLDRIWKYKIIECSIDPINEIINEYKKQNPDLGKIAFLKELGRASYESPLSSGGSISTYFNSRYRKQAEESAKIEKDFGNVEKITNCPACGTKSLIIYNDVETDERDPKTGTFNKAWQFNTNVKCMCCSFEIHNNLKNPQEYGYDIENYWFSKEL